MIGPPRLGHRWLVWCLLHSPWLLFLLSAGATLWASEAGFLSPISTFKVENHVFSGEGQLLSQSVTLVLHTKAYDFLDEPPQIVVLDFAGRRFTVLSPIRGEQTDVNFQTALLFLERLQNRAGQQRDPSARFAADPQFEMAYHEATATYSFSSPWMSYRIHTTTAVDPGVCRKFWEVSSWLCRVNTLLVPGSRPPFPRLAVNQNLADKGVFPVEIEYQSGPRNFLEWLPGRRVALRSTHRLVLELQPADQQRVEEVERHLRTFRRVSLTDYQSQR